MGAAGGSGGDGGNGGSGSATVSALNVDVTGGLNLTVNLIGLGGAGGAGGVGSSAGAGVNILAQSLDGVGSYLRTDTLAENGDGGDGGNGGTGTAQMLNSTVNGSGAVDWVNILLHAAGGAGGFGSTGGQEVADSSTTSGDAYVVTLVTIGGPAGAVGADGAAGAGVATMTGNTINLRGGDDTLTLALSADGPGARSVNLSGNSFIGGNGTDTITVGAQAATDRDVVFDVVGGRVRVDGARNSMTGFDVFNGGSGRDQFLDGAGSQTYAGNLGADLFEFRGGQAGADRIDGLAADDVIRLRGFGSGLNSFAEVLAATTDTAQGALIQTGAGSSILLAGVLGASLVADDFAF